MGEGPGPAGPALEAGAELLEVVRYAIEVHRLGRGAFDLSRGRDAIVHQPWESATGDEAGRHAVDPTNPTSSTT